MSKRPRRNHSPAFKAKVAPAVSVAGISRSAACSSDLLPCKRSAGVEPFATRRAEGPPVTMAVVRLEAQCGLLRCVREGTLIYHTVLPE